MLDINAYLYKYIGKRVDMRINELGCTVMEIIENFIIHHDTLSEVRNGKTTKKNPYLLSDGNIEVFSKIIERTVSELIFGTQTQKEELVKNILLALLYNDKEILICNDDNEIDILNPFEVISSESEILSREEWRKHMSKYNHMISFPEADLDIDFFKKGGYLNIENAEGFSLIEKNHNFDFIEASAIMFKNVLIYNERLTHNFFEVVLHRLHQIVYPQLHIFTFTDEEISEYENEIDMIRKENKNYSELFLNPNNRDYILFMPAFEKYWLTHKDTYMSYFENELFLKFEKVKSMKMKKLKNKLIPEFISPDSFTILVKSCFEKDKAYNSETIINALTFEMNLLKNSEKLKIYKHRDSDSSAYYELLEMSIAKSMKKNR